MHYFNLFWFHQYLQFRSPLLSWSLWLTMLISGSSWIMLTLVLLWIYELFFSFLFFLLFFYWGLITIFIATSIQYEGIWEFHIVQFASISYQETFEFLNILQVHGFPKVMGVLTHLDQFKDAKKLRKTKQRLKHRFWTEIYDGAKLFYLSGLIHGQ